MSDSALLDRLKAMAPEQLARLRSATAARATSGHALVAEALKLCGIKRVYGVTGTPVDQTFAECAAMGIRPISTGTQNAAVLMAAAGNYAAGRLEAAVIVSAGPGVTNTVTGLLAARENGWPVIVLGGRRAIDKQGIGYFQELDALPIMSPVTKLAATATATSEISEVISRAVASASSTPRGPVYVDLPEDVLQGSAPLRSAMQLPVARSSAIEVAAVEEAVQLIAQAQRPLLIVGEEIRWTYRAETLRALVDEFGIPFITAPLARGYLPDDHPLCANEVHRSFQGHADVIIMAGAWFDWRFRFGTELAPDARVIHATNDAETLGKNVAPAVCVLGEPGAFLNELASSLSQKLKSAPGERWTRWHRSLGEALERSRRARAEWLQQQSMPMQPQQLYLALRDLLPDDAIVAVEGNICLAAAQKILRARRAASWFDPGRNGVIGSAIPFALGAKLAFPTRPVFALCSDTGFAMSAMELEPAVRHQIPIITVIANNDGNSGAVRQKAFFLNDYPERFSEFLPELRYERIAEVFGAHAAYITEPSQIRPAVERALASGLPACLNVQLDPHAPHPGFW